MENIIYNELLMRGLNVDVGIVEIREGGRRIQTEVDCLAHRRHVTRACSSNILPPGRDIYPVVMLNKRG